MQRNLILASLTALTLIGGAFAQKATTPATGAATTGSSTTTGSATTGTSTKTTGAGSTSGASSSTTKPMSGAAQRKHATRRHRLHVNANTATLRQLERIPSMTARDARNVIAARSFASQRDFETKVKGLSKRNIVRFEKSPTF